MTYTETLYAFVAFALAVSLAGFMAMVWDKESARKRTWRIPEYLLLAIALVGGSIGIVVGQKVMRHKHGKYAFQIYLRMIVIVQFTVLMALSFPTTRDYLINLLP